jgi:hypothetical protein
MDKEFFKNNVKKQTITNWRKNLDKSKGNYELGKRGARKKKCIFLKFKS